MLIEFLAQTRRVITVWFSVNYSVCPWRAYFHCLHWPIQFYRSLEIHVMSHEDQLDGWSWVLMSWSESGFPLRGKRSKFRCSWRGRSWRQTSKLKGCVPCLTKPLISEFAFKGPSPNWVNGQNAFSIHILFPLMFAIATFTWMISPFPRNQQVKRSPDILC